MIYIFWTCRNKTEAKTITYALLEKRLVACASLFPEMESMYRWQGKIEESVEVKVIFKTRVEHFDAIQAFIQAHCSYEVAEIVQVEACRVSSNYLSWVLAETLP